MKRKLSLLLRFLAFFCVAAIAARAQYGYPDVPIVQANTNNTSGASATCSFNQNVTSGNQMWIGIAWESSTNTPSVSDTRSTSYTQKLLNTSNTVKVAFFAGTLGSSGSNTVTVAITSGAFIGVNCLEMYPRWTLTVDQTAVSAFSGSPSTVTTPAVTNTVNGDIVYHLIYRDNTSGWFQQAVADMPKWTQTAEYPWIGAWVGVGGVEGVSGNNLTVNANVTLGTTFTISFKPSSGITINSGATAPDGATSQAYSFQPLATGGVAAYTWSISAGSLPTGLSINSSTGLISGTPSVSNNFSFTVQATDGTSTATQAMTAKIATGVNTPTLIQSASCSVGTGGCTGSFGSNVTSGDFIAAAGGWNGAVPFQIPYCTDSLGTPFKLYALSNYLSKTASSNLQTIMIFFYGGFAPSTGADTVSCGSAGAPLVNQVAEFSNVGPYIAGDNFGGTFGTSAQPATITSNTLTTLVPNELLWGSCSAFSSAGRNTINSPFTAIAAANIVQSGYNISTSVTTYTLSCAQATNTDTDWGILLLALRPSGGTVTPPTSHGFPVVF